MNAIFSRMKKIFFSVLGEIWEDKNKSEGDMFIKWPWAQFLWKTIQKNVPCEGCTRQVIGPEKRVRPC